MSLKYAGGDSVTLIIPAIDIRGGKCVRLVHGRVDRETIYGEDPSEMARRWVGDGAQFLHLVDLDGAFEGMPVNLSSVEGIVAAVDVPVQLGGGLRTYEDIKRVLEMGVTRVILGTRAINDPGFAARAVTLYSGERIVAGIDIKDGRPAAKGWLELMESTPVELARTLREVGLARAVVTDVSKDGTLAGPNVELAAEIAAGSGLKTIVSGGVGSAADVLRVTASTEPGIEGVIVGKALYDGRIDLKALLKEVK
ncbi:1-(5-phosphoribosyl)-5-[(5-phosphoribosylamino)methylideneamino]imidazole-4-carboxamide isomerase [candidate division KSB1 bacterium]